MFIYFDKLKKLDNVLSYIQDVSQDSPKIIISDYKFLSISENSKIFQNIMDNNLTLEFYVIDSAPIKDIEDALVINNMIDAIYNINIINTFIFNQNFFKIDRINNICSIKTNNYEKNDFLYNLITDDFYTKSFSKPILFFLLFSSLLDLIDFIGKYDLTENIYIILKPQENYKDLNITSFVTTIESLIN